MKGCTLAGATARRRHHLGHGTTLQWRHCGHRVVALTLQLLVTINSMTTTGTRLAAAVWRYLGYFTILTSSPWQRSATRAA